MFDEHAECEKEEQERDYAQDEHNCELVSVASFRQSSSSMMMLLMIVIAIARIGRVVAVIFGGGMISEWVLYIVFTSNNSYHDQCQ